MRGMEGGGGRPCRLPPPYRRRGVEGRGLGSPPSPLSHHRLQLLPLLIGENRHHPLA